MQVACSSDPAFFGLCPNKCLDSLQDNARRSGTPLKDIFYFMAFRLRIGKCWARWIEETEERKFSYKTHEGRTAFFTRGKKGKGCAFATIFAVCSKQSLLVQRLQIRTKIKCVLCDVFLCVAGDRNCFMQYHKD